MSELSEVPAELEGIAEEFVARLRQGESPQLSEYTQRYPQLADLLCEVLPALAVIERLKPTGSEVSDDVSVAGSEDIQPATQIGDFEVLREVGRGGMGVVYEAIQKSLNRRVALKVLPHQVLQGEERVARFDREARAAARLHHTHIVPVYDFGSCEGIHYFSMQFINGAALSAVLSEVRRIREHPPGKAEQQDPKKSKLVGSTDETLRSQLADTIRSSDAARMGELLEDRPLVRGQGYSFNVARIGVEVARALGYAHQQGVLHRDIKPSNLILDTHGHIWVTDFGLAATEDDEALTSSGDILGTFRYMAPEAFNGQFDRRSDVYSLGATLYELLALRPAYLEKDRARLVRMILNESPPRLRSLEPSIPRDLETIVHKAMHRNPAARYQSAESLADDLDRFLKGKPILAQKISAFTHVSHWMIRNPVSATLSAVALFLLIATTVVSLLAAVRLNSSAKELKRAKELAVAREQEARQLAAMESEARADAEVQLRRAKRIEEFMKRTLRSPHPDRDGRQVTIYEVLSRTLGEIDEELSDDPHLRLLALLSIHDAFIGLDEIPDALDVIQSADQLSVEILDRNDPLRINVRYLVGSTQRLAGRLPEAYDTLDKVYQDSQRLFGTQAELTIRIACHLGNVLFALGREDEAEQFFNETYGVARQALGPTHELTLTCLHNLATHYQTTRRAELAIPILEQAWQLQAQHLGETKQATLNSRVGLGGAMRDAKQTDKALAWLTETLELCRDNLGDRHTTTLACLNNLAMALADKGEFSEAISAMREVEQGRVATQGEQHPSVLTAQVNLAGMLVFTKQYVEAVEILEKARLNAVDLLGHTHWRSTKIGAELATAQKKAGQSEKSITTIHEVLRDQYAVRSDENLEAMIAKVNMGTLLCEAGELSEAATIFQSAIEAAQQRWGEHSGQVRNLVRWYHQTLMAQREWNAVLTNSDLWQACLDESATDIERRWRLADTAYALFQTESIEAVQSELAGRIEKYAELEPAGYMHAWTRHLQGLLLASNNSTVSEAEPILEKSTQDLLAASDNLPGKDQFRLTFAIENMIWFYSEVQPNAEARARWQNHLDQRLQTATVLAP